MWLISAFAGFAFEMMSVLLIMSLSISAGMLVLRMMGEGLWEEVAAACMGLV